MSKVFHLIFFVFCFSVSEGFSQENENNIKYNCTYDTLLIINGKTLCDYKNYLNRSDILDSDTLYVNQKGIKVDSYVISSFTLGNRLQITVNSNLVNPEFKNAIASEEIIYKYINVENVILIDSKNNYVKSTFQNLKIIFLD